MALLLFLLPLFGLWGMAIEYVVTPIVLVFVVYLYLIKIRPFPFLDTSKLLSFTKDDKDLLRYVIINIKKVITRKNKV